MQQTKRIECIQLIRGIACAMVILCHTRATEIGQTGVDFFFVISGFVIMLSTEEGVKRFWTKRLIKLLPFYWLMTLFTSMAIIILPSLFNSYELSIEYLIKSLILIPYYHRGISGPILHIGWTLYYEIFFYFIFWGASMLDHKKRGIWSILIIVVLVFLNYTLRLPMPFDYWCAPVMLEFCYGILVYMIFKWCKIRRSKLHVTNFIFTLSIIIGCI